MIYGSICSGIEAATVAWEPLGWKAAWFAEIEAFPSAVLAERWPEVVNLGDMTKIAASVRAGDVQAPDVMVGGTPCQAFSIAGLRNGLSDARGQLTLSYVELANAIDDKRRERGEEAAIFVWENVPGVLSSKDNAFGCFLAGLAGESAELQPAGRKWTNAGCVYGPQRTIAWIVKDAQYFGVAQRRRRVFVVASARKEFDPSSVLFESEGVRRDTPPSREPQTAVAALTANGVGTCGADDNQGQAGHLIAAFGGGNGTDHLDVAACLTARGQRIDFEVETFLAQYSSTGQGFWSEGPGTLRAREQESHEHVAVMAVHGTQDPDTLENLAHTLGRNHGQENAVIAFNSKDYGQDAAEEISPTLRAGCSVSGNQNAGSPPAIAYSMQVRRLTPIECERLQGFPDNHTLISWRGKEVAECSDGPRYRAIGNSMAVPVMRWIGDRIAAAIFQISSQR